MCEGARDRTLDETAVSSFMTCTSNRWVRWAEHVACVVEEGN